MKKSILLVFFLLQVFFLFSQELEEEGYAIPAEKNKVEKEDSPFIEQMDMLFHTPYYGPFHVERYKLDFNLTDIAFSSDKDRPYDILSIARAEENQRRSYMRDFKAPIRQLQQIQSQVQIFGYNSSNLDGTFEYNRKVRNDALLENRQPFSPHYPYYGRFGRPNYYDLYYGSPMYMNYYRR